ncbi:MAG: Mutual gliding-motility protein MglA [Candidatus Heimdallarchaeota archaeon AB_125]|nr:MAG: Mutual gliding-motility protein MglA [Candidatus Heimdallarchaeota archaeon AB_125]
MSQIELSDIFTVDREGKPTIKIVLFGPPMSGKTSMLTVFNALRRMENPKTIVSALTKIQDDTGRTVFFDQGVFQTPPFKGKKFDRLRYQLWTIPGEERHKTQRDIVMKGVDAVLLFLNFEKTAEEQNKVILKEAKETVGETFGSKIPVVAYINKSDLPAEERLDKRDIIKSLIEEGAIHSDKAANIVLTGSCLNARNELLSILTSPKRDEFFDDSNRLRIDKRPDSVWLIVRPIQKLTQLAVEQRLEYVQNF